jgi:hypothetical protein
VVEAASSCRAFITASHTGAAIANASRPATVVVQQPATVVVQQPAYYTQGNLPMGTQLAALPPASTSMVVNGVNDYQSGPSWYKPYFGSSRVPSAMTRPATGARPGLAGAGAPCAGPRPGRVLVPRLRRQHVQAIRPRVAGAVAGQADSHAQRASIEPHCPWAQALEVSAR